ncbi:MAG: hypothetical protein NZ840_07420 [Anaerolineales bacterium]|nr:hypothetical protein [Anaerolineales bacterium]MDW8161868.1 hypothetical protein [Anaerolineales bacterium]
MAAGQLEFSPQMAGIQPVDGATCAAKRRTAWLTVIGKSSVKNASL